MHGNLKFHSYKLMVAQELLKQDHENRVACCKDMVENVPANAVLTTSDKAHFHLCGLFHQAKFLLQGSK